MKFKIPSHKNQFYCQISLLTDYTQWIKEENLFSSMLITFCCVYIEYLSFSSIFIISLSRFSFSIPEVHIQSRSHSIEASLPEFKYSAIPQGLAASFPARRPSMCIITDQLMQFHRAAKIHPPGSFEEDQELDEDSQSLEDNVPSKKRIATNI